MPITISELPKALQVKDEDTILVEQNYSKKISISDFKDNISRLSGLDDVKNQTNEISNKRELLKYKLEEASNHILNIKQTMAEMLNQILDSDDVEANDESIINGINIIENNKCLKEYYEKYVTYMAKLFINNTIMEVAPDVNTENVTDMKYMFSGCTNLTTVPEYNTGNVTDMQYMFYNCTNLTTVPEFDTRNVNNMQYMFYNCSNLTTIHQYNTENVTDMQYMFYNCSNLNSVPKFDTGKVTNTSNMFAGCTNLTTVPEFDTGNITNTSNMFSGCTNLTTVPEFDTRNVNNMQYMFYRCKLIQEVYLDTTSVKNMEYIFLFCYNLTKIRFNPDAGNIADFSISDCTKMTSEDLVAMFESLPTVQYTRTITLGSTLLNRLTKEQKQIAIDKNYKLS